MRNRPFPPHTTALKRHSSPHETTQLAVLGGLATGRMTARLLTSAQLRGILRYVSFIQNRAPVRAEAARGTARQEKRCEGRLCRPCRQRQLSAIGASLSVCCPTRRPPQQGGCRPASGLLRHGLDRSGRHGYTVRLRCLSACLVPSTASRPPSDHPAPVPPTPPPTWGFAESVAG